MPSQFITTNIRIPASLHKTLKRRALESGKSLAEIIRATLNLHNSISAKSQKKISIFDGLKKISGPMGGDLSANIDDIVYGKNSN